MRALICGVSGQDGALLARLLFDKGFEVVGTSRDAQVSGFTNLGRMAIPSGAVSLISMAPNNLRSVLQTVKRVAPDEVYNLSGQSSVGFSFDQPVETLESIANVTHNFLEVLRFLERPIRFYNAGSSECFGETPAEGADELSPLRPRSPYGVAKSTIYWQVANYREAYGIAACTGILFNHESPLRPDIFVTRKIISATCRIKRGSGERLRLGNLDIHLDWGSASEYVQAMWRMLLADSPMEDYVIATGRTHSLRDFAELSFVALGLDWQAHTDIDLSLYRPTEIGFSRGDPGNAKARLGWHAGTSFEQLIDTLVKAEWDLSA